MRVEVEVGKNMHLFKEVLVIAIKVTANDGRVCTYQQALEETEFLSLFDVVMEKITRVIKGHMLKED